MLDADNVKACREMTEVYIMAVALETAMCYQLTARIVHR